MESMSEKISLIPGWDAKYNPVVGSKRTYADNIEEHFSVVEEEIEDERVNDDVGCCTKKRFPCLPEWYRVEFNCTWRLAWPMILTQMLQYLIFPVSLAFCGRLDTVQFGAAALAMTVSNVTGVVLGSGLVTACDTLFSQTFGSDNLKRIGVLLQRSMIYMCLCILPIWAFHLNTESFLILVGQEPEQAAIAGRYLVIFMPGLLFNFQFQVLLKYLQNQNIVFPLIWIGIFGNAVSALFHYIFIVEMNMGTDGAALGQGIGYFSMFLSTACYIYFTGLYKPTWAGWTLEAFAEWGSFTKYAVPGMLALFFDMFCFELGTFAAGLLSAEELAAQSTILQISAVAYQLPLGVSYACSIRVGQHLGAGDYEAAKRAVKVSITIGGVAAVICMTLFASSGTLVPSIFTDDKCVYGLAGQCMPLLAVYELFDSISAMLNGSLRGCGRQHIGAFAILIGFYFVGSPVALSLMFLTPLRTQGFWIGMSCAVFGCFVVTGIIIMCFTDWKREARLARRRAGLKARARSRSRVSKTETSELLHTTSTQLSEISLTSSTQEEFQCSQVLFTRILTFCILLLILLAGVFIRNYVHLGDLYGKTDAVPMVPIDGNTTWFPVHNHTNPICLPFL